MCHQGVKSLTSDAFIETWAYTWSVEHFWATFRWMFLSQRWQVSLQIIREGFSNISWKFGKYILKEKVTILANVVNIAAQIKLVIDIISYYNIISIINIIHIIITNAFNTLQML